MQAKCSAKASEFARVEGRRVVAEFDGGRLTSDAGGLLLVRPTKQSVSLNGYRDVFAMRADRS
jgi:hypothetical protein